MSKKIKFINILFFIAIIVFLFPSCGKEKGEFAYKFVLDDAYRKMEGNKEFPHDEKVQWAYVYKSTPASKKVGVILLKKEIVWVENDARFDFVDRSKKVIFGTIEDLVEGRYKIMLTNISTEKKIDEFEFLIYNDQKDYEME